MSKELNDEEHLIWDPMYPNLGEFAKDFDYDLLGQNVRQSDRFFEDPESYIERWLREKRMEIIVTGFSLILLVVGVLMFRVVVINQLIGSMRFLKYFLTLRSIKNKYIKFIKTAGDTPIDVDVLAADVYRQIVATRTLYKYEDDTDMAEYEAGRFVWEIIQETGLCYEEPWKKSIQELAGNKVGSAKETQSIAK